MSGHFMFVEFVVRTKTTIIYNQPNNIELNCFHSLHLANKRSEPRRTIYFASIYVGALFSVNVRSTVKCLQKKKKSVFSEVFLVSQCVPFGVTFVRHLFCYSLICRQIINGNQNPSTSFIYTPHKMPIDWQSITSIENTTSTSHRKCL